MTKEILKLIEEQNEIDKLIIELNDKKNTIIDRLFVYYDRINKSLDDLGFYLRYRDDLLKRFVGTLYYKFLRKDCGEGDYIELNFNIINENLHITKTCSWDSFQNIDVCEIPLILFEEGQKEKLEEFINTIINKQNEHIKNEKKVEKERKKKALLKELKELDNN